MITNINGPRPLISVVLPALNEEEFLFECLVGLTMQDFPHPFEIIIVDNGSIDSTSEIVEQFPQMRLLRNPIRGVSKTRNTGFAAARAKYIVSTDADCLHPKDWLSKAYEKIQEEGVVAVGGYAISYDSWLVGHTSNITRHMHILKASKVMFGAQACSTQCLAIKKSAWEAVGGFDESIKSTWELDDADFTIRLNKVGKVKEDNDFIVYASARRVTGDTLGFLQKRAKGYWKYTRRRESAIIDKYKDVRDYIGEVSEEIPVVNKISSILKDRDNI